MAAVQTGAMQLSVDIFNSAPPSRHPLKTDIQIKGVCVTKVHYISTVRRLLLLLVVVVVVVVVVTVVVVVVKVDHETRRYSYSVEP